MAFWDWIKNKIKNSSLVPTNEDRGTHTMHQPSSLDTPRNEIWFEKESLNDREFVPNNLSKLKQEYERLCKVLEHIKKTSDDNSKAVLASLPELPTLSYSSTSVKVYTPPTLDSLPTMVTLREERLEVERYQRMMHEQEVTKRLGMVSDYIGVGDYVKAHEVLDAAGKLINTIENKDVELRYTKLSKTLIRREEEEKILKREKRSEERKRKKKEKEEKQKFINFLQSKNSRCKVGHMIALQDFNDNGIAYLYHFTSKKNLKSISKNGGLYARAYHSRLDITVKDSLPEARLVKNNNTINFSEYISLSICKEHYLAREQFDAGVDVCILKIRTDVVEYYNTYFTDRDTSNDRFRIGNGYQDTDYINFDAVKDDNLTIDDINYAQKYAEVLVDTFIPIGLIENIDNPIKLK